MNRTARFAGTWYPTTRKEIEQFINPKAHKETALGAVCPHAGWIYSGTTAGAVFSRLKPAHTYIIIGPNHSGMGAPVSVYDRGGWETPLGPLMVDTELAAAIIKHDSAASGDVIAHQQEHSIEVQLPFIKYFSPDALIVPIALGDYRPAVCKKLGSAITAALRELHKETGTLIIASSDMSHYISATAAAAADKPAIERMLARDPEGLLRQVTADEITMCGSGPVAVMLHAVNALGAKGAELVNYTHSGAASGDLDQVVAYAGIVVS